MDSLVANTTKVFAHLNEILSAAIIILTFSLSGYMIVRNWRSSSGRGMAALLACVCFTYMGDVAIFQADNLRTALPWLKFQWIGIAFTPAAYLHFSDAVLRLTNALSTRRRVAVLTAYFFGLLLFLLAIYTEYLVRDPFYSPGVTQFRAGAFFWVFAVYFYTTLVWGVYKIFYARARCLTSGARRRMTHLAISLAAPALGVFPYMLIANSTSGTALQPFIPIILFPVNLGIAVMIIVMAYSVSFFGAISPDRVVRHNLVHFLLRGPVTATLVIFIFLVLPKKSHILGLPRELILGTSIVGIIVLWQLLINIVKPIIDRVVFYQDRLEITWIGELDRRLLTTTDLQQALENVLITLCETLRVRNGFVYNLTAHQGPRMEALVGDLTVVEQALADIDVPKLIQQKNGGKGPHFIIQKQFWFVLLQNESRNHYLGLLGIEGRSESYDLTSDEEQSATLMIEQIELALDDRRLQQEVFAALKNIMPEMERVHRLRKAVPYTGSSNLTSLTESPINEKDFSKMVWDALSHYWGGPKLTSSPLLGLQVVQQALVENDGNTVRALRSVLAQAIEKQRPEGERRMTTAEWLMYNILDLKFVQGMRVRDIAQRLSMSEADLYRKQRLAIEEVARTLREMEARGASQQFLYLEQKKAENSKG